MTNVFLDKHFADRLSLSHTVPYEMTVGLDVQEGQFVLGSFATGQKLLLRKGVSVENLHTVHFSWSAFTFTPGIDDGIDLTRRLTVEVVSESEAEKLLQIFGAFFVTEPDSSKSLKLVGVQVHEPNVHETNVKKRARDDTAQTDKPKRQKTKLKTVTVNGRIIKPQESMDLAYKWCQDVGKDYVKIEYDGGGVRRFKALVRDKWIAKKNCKDLLDFVQEKSGRDFYKEMEKGHGQAATHSDSSSDDDIFALK